METEEFFDFPGLIDNCFIRAIDSGLSIESLHRSVSFGGLPPSLVGELHEWLVSSSDGRPLSDGAAFPSKKRKYARLLRALDSAGMIVERSAKPQSGASVLSRIEQKMLRQIEGASNSPFGDALAQTTLTRQQLIGNAFEYYFITLGAYDALAPCLPRLKGEVQKALASFVLEEYRHDRITFRAIAACGFTEDDIANVVPLGFTSAIVAEMFYLAHTDPLALLACLFVVEGRPETGAQYIEALGRHSIPPAYVESHLEHDRINTNGAHASISRKCFKSIEFISAEDERRITAKVLMLHDMGVERNRELMRYYGDPDNPCPRTIDELAERANVITACTHMSFDRAAV